MLKHKLDEIVGELNWLTANKLGKPQPGVTVSTMGVVFITGLLTKTTPLIIMLVWAQIASLVPPLLMNSCAEIWLNQQNYLCMDPQGQGMTEQHGTYHYFTPLLLNDRNAYRSLWSSCTCGNKPHGIYIHECVNVNVCMAAVIHTKMCSI